MDDNLKTIYRILKYLEASMDYDELDIEPIQHEALGITENRRNNIIKMLLDNGYAEGQCRVKTYIANKVYAYEHDLQALKITLKGLEYLEESSLMQRAANLAKGIKEIIPGL